MNATACGVSGGALCSFDGSDNSKFNVKDISSTKGFTDAKNYEVLQFPTGFETLVVSLPPKEQSAQAAVALCVNVGSFSDPLEAQGLAHFLGSICSYYLI